MFHDWLKYSRICPPHSPAVCPLTPETGRSRLTIKVKGYKVMSHALHCTVAACFSSLSYATPAAARPSKLFCEQNFVRG
ncbi:hypothetical protein RR48_03563 [Papilio machaon]|uniref:Uncharacterized protein n=1 Tax=Papilio machaon TaxID=76193 RepID=A0A0N1IE06_PAPMA|nr:hypothetical protein RR48_03563 [Papilio machaon]